MKGRNRITITLPPDLQASLTARAQEHGVPVATLAVQEIARAQACDEWRDRFRGLENQVAEAQRVADRALYASAAEFAAVQRLLRILVSDQGQFDSLAQGVTADRDRIYRRLRREAGMTEEEG